MTDSQDDKITPSFIFQFILGSFISVVFLTSTYQEFSDYAQYMHILKTKTWVKKDVEISPKTEIEIFHFRNNQSEITFKKDQQKIFSKSCNGQLELICKYIDNHEIQIISLSFYTYLNQNKSNYDEFLLNTITFKDQQERLQVFPYMHYPPNSPQYITETKVAFRRFFIFAFIKHLVFALMFLGFSISFNLFSQSTQRIIHYFIISVFTLSFLSFVLRYLLM